VIDVTLKKEFCVFFLQKAFSTPRPFISAEQQIVQFFIHSHFTQIFLNQLSHIVFLSSISNLMIAAMRSTHQRNRRLWWLVRRLGTKPHVDETRIRGTKMILSLFYVVSTFSLSVRFGMSILHGLTLQSYQTLIESFPLSLFQAKMSSIDHHNNIQKGRISIFYEQTNSSIMKIS
jgi:hypothetical protein